MLVYFFAGALYTLLNRGETGAGSIVPGYNPARPISDFKFPVLPGSTTHFGSEGIDAALSSGSKYYFFKDNYYVRATQIQPGEPNTITQDFTEAHPISEWGFCDGFGKNGIDSALWSGPVTYFFSGTEYIRVTRGEDDFGNGCDPGYPKSIEDIWDWPGDFGTKVKAALPSGLVDYFFHENGYIRVNRGIELDGYLDGGYPNYNAHAAWGFPDDFATNGPDAALYAGGEFQPEPAGGLSSNNNYFLADAGKNLMGVTVTIDIDDDLVSTSDGFGFQLNAFSPLVTDQTAAWGQQMIVLSPRGTNQLQGWIFHYNDAWDVSFDQKVTLATLPAVNTIKGGSQVTITVLNDASTGKVTGATFGYTPAGGSAVAPQTINILGHNLESGQPATTAYMQPIVTFSLDIVADYSTSPNPPYGNAVLTGGEGSITYSAAGGQPLTAFTTIPTQYTRAAGTGETANTVYAPLPGGRAIDVSQLWGMTPPVPVDLSGLVGAQPQVVHNVTTFHLPAPGAGKRAVDWSA